MEPRLLLFFCVLVLNCQRSFAQDTASQAFLIFSPALLQPSSFAVQSGLQYTAGKRLELLVEAAVPIWHMDQSYEKVLLWRTAIECKFSRSGFVNSSRYVVLQASYHYRRLVDTDSGKLHLRTGEYQYREAVIKSPVLAVAVKFGRELLLANGKRIFDVFIGIGGRHLFNHYFTQGLRPAISIIEFNKLPWFLHSNGWQYEDPAIRLHLMAGFRIGWKL